MSTPSVTQPSMQNSNTQPSASSSVDIIVFSGRIDHAGYRELVKICSAGRREEVILILNTVGGNPDAGYKIAKYLQNNYKKFTLFIACVCKSAGTLIAVGAHELVFSEIGELGPLDVQLRKDHELGEEYTSGLDMISALDYLNAKTLETFGRFLMEFRFGGQLSTEVASRMATPLVTALYASLYQQIDPVTLGDITRSMDIASAYGVRLERIGKNLKPGTLARLVSDYPSHSFVIDFDEATELFHHIRRCSPPEAHFATMVANGHSDKVAQSPAHVALLNPASPPSPSTPTAGTPEQATPNKKPSAPSQPDEKPADNFTNDTKASNDDAPNTDGGSHDLPPTPTDKRHRSGRTSSSDGSAEQPAKTK